MKNKLYVGFRKDIDLTKGSFLLIDDEVPVHPKAKVFDPLKHSFNPLRHIDKKKARELVSAIYAASPQGENTLTVRNGRRALATGLAEAKRLGAVHIESPVKGVAEEVEGMLDELLFTDVMRDVLCSDDGFGFTGKNTKVFARINRAEIGEFDALVLGLLLISHFKGQIILPDAGFYLRDIHVSLIREKRLIAGVTFIDELPDKLRGPALLIPDKVLQGALYDDAVLLAKHNGLHPDPSRESNPFNDFIQDAMA